MSVSTAKNITVITTISSTIALLVKLSALNAQVACTKIQLLML